MKISNLFLILLLIISSFQIVSAQLKSVAPESYEAERRAAATKIRHEEINNRLGGRNSQGMIADRRSEYSPKELYKGKNREDSALRKQFDNKRNLLKPSKEYAEIYKDLSKKLKMKMFRLHEEKNCNFEMVISAEDSERCAEVIPIFGNGSYYSFPLQTHYYIQSIYIRADTTTTLVTGTPKLGFTGMGNWWNIHFNDGIIESNKGLIIDISNEVGQKELENFSLKSPLLNFLKSYGKEKTIVSIKFEKDEIIRNTKEESENKEYPKSARMVVGNTYLVHLFATENITLSTRKNGKVDRFVANKPAATFVFKIMAQEADNSLIVLEKKLKDE